jgi:HK97 family phage portal protein
MFDALARIFARRQVQPPPEERRSVLAWPARSDAGIFITEDVALGCSTAWACGTLIARSIAMLPARVMAPRGPDEADGNERLPDHPVEALLHREANPEMSAFQFREASLLSAIFKGNSFAEIERDQLGRPFALWPLHSDRVTVYHDSNSNALGYEVDNGANGKVTLEARNVFHLAGPSLYAPVGMSLISYARQTLGVAIAQERFAGNFIRNQAAPSGMVKVKNITADGFKRLKAEFDQINRGPKQAGKVFYGDGDWEWVQLGVSPQDAEFINQRRFSVEEICRWFGVPPQMVGDTSKQTFANFEQAGLNFLTLAISPWVVRFEQEANRKLLARPGIRVPFVKLNTAAITRANLEASYRSFALGRQWGWLSVNDIRRLIDMEPIGPEGDVYLQPMNMTPIGETPADDQQTTEGDQQRATALRRVK